VAEEPDRFGDSLGRAITRQIHEELLEEFAEESRGRGRRQDRSARVKPEGIVTIAFTDVVDSTGLVFRLGDEAARDLIRQHDAVLRETARANEGVEVERAGDGFMIAFSTASRAVRFAIELQRALGVHPTTAPAGIQVRIGMETGETIAEEQGYFGKTVFAASRITDLADGGQILISQTTRLISDGGGFVFRDAGEHDLKGLGGPHHLFEVDWTSER
jgi:class 3 adenylate cyclase